MTYRPTIVAADPLPIKKAANPPWVSPPEGSSQLGRPSKFTHERQEAILRSLRAGSTLKIAALANGIHPNTLNEWRRRYPDFADAVNTASGVAAELWLLTISNAAIRRDDVRAAMWLLERRFPEDFAKGSNQLGPHRAGGDPTEQAVIYRPAPSYEHQLEVARLLIEHDEQNKLDAGIIEAEAIEEDDDGYGPMLDETGTGVHLPEGREEHR